MTRVKINTTLGDFTVELNTERAPKSCENFLAYVQAGHYDGTIFHRVIKNFMIQGGHFTTKMGTKTTRDPIENEAKNGLPNAKYTIAMARTMSPHSATDQFFINTKDNQFLNYPGQDGWGYAVFGKVVEGRDVIDQIEHVRTGRTGMHADVPLTDVTILSAKVVLEVAGWADATNEAAAVGTEDDLPAMADDFNDELLATYIFIGFMESTDLTKYGGDIVTLQQQAQQAVRELYVALNNHITAEQTAAE